MTATPTPQPEMFRFEDDGAIPNSPLPLLLYRAALTSDGDDPARAFETTFAANGWTRTWRNGIYGFHHFHSTAHEVLGVARGHGRVRFGGAGGATLDLAAGDVVVIPAGVGHKNEGSSGDLLIVGGYAGGRNWDLRRGRREEHDETVANIEKVPPASSDPVAGEGGPLVGMWRSASG